MDFNSLFHVTLVSLLLGCFPLNIGTEAVRVNISPKQCIATIEKSVEISCLPDETVGSDTEITVIEVSRNNEDPMAFLHQCSNITYATNLTRQFQAKGHINKESGKSYFNLTLINPTSEDTGVYTCAIWYFNSKGHVTEERSSENLRVDRLDTKSLENTLTTLKERISSLTKKAEEQDSNVANRLTVIERNVNAHTLQITGLTEKVSYDTSFSTSTNSNLVPSQGETLVLPDVIHQNGTDFNPTTGLFTASRAGLYTFSLTAMVTANKHVNIEIQKNGKALATIHAIDKTYNDPASVTVVTSLAVGDVIRPYVRTIWRGSSVFEHPYTVFSGFLARPY